MDTTILRLASLALAAASVATAFDGFGPPPRANFSTIPLAFHGANMSGPWTDDAIEQLSKYGMVTTEKWDQPCGGTHPQMNAPCGEEEIMLASLERVRQRNPNIILLAYLNSVIDFSFYDLHGTLADLEANGTKVWMRDENGEVVVLDNDGSFYWDIKRFDVTSPAMLKAWQDKVEWFRSRGVDGIFADHGNKFLELDRRTGKNSLCDGKGDRFRCFNFSNAFAQRWNAAHTAQLAWAQAQLWPYPVIDSLNATWSVHVCDFESHKAAVDRGMWVEAKGYCSYHEDCTAAFLAAAGPRSFAACFASQSTSKPDMPPWEKEFDYPLGEPTGAAREGPLNVWTRDFASGTRVVYNSKTQKGTVTWAAETAAAE